MNKEKSRRWLAAVVLSGVSVASSAGQIDITTFNTIRIGMNEGEVLVRAGPPDLRVPLGAVETTFDSFYGTTETTAFVNELHYIPDSSEHDPHLTVITIRGGKVHAIDRTKVFSRTLAPSSSNQYAPTQQTRSDHDIKVQRADRTLQAAQRYAETRARLKAAAEPTLTTDQDVYSEVQADGSTYFGDRPPDE
mgnify:CR=1 FL=1